MSNFFSILLFIFFVSFTACASTPEVDFPRDIPSSNLKSTYWNSLMAGAIRGGVYVVEHPLVTTMDRVALSGHSSTFILRKLLKER